jgi:zinc ribbon protein
MTSMEITTQSIDEIAPGPRRFACPACGSTLRVGAILCPHCGADLWTVAHGGPPPPAQAAAAATPLASDPGSADGRPGRRSLGLASTALGALLLLLLAATVDGSSWRWSASAWLATLVAAAVVSIAWRAGGRFDGTNERRPLAARYGLILGMAGLASVASALITGLIDQMIRSVFG